MSHSDYCPFSPVPSLFPCRVDNAVDSGLLAGTRLGFGSGIQVGGMDSLASPAVVVGEEVAHVSHISAL